MINLYIAECFSDIETNGVDIFGGWEGADDTVEALDTADPIVIARCLITLHCLLVFNLFICLQMYKRMGQQLKLFDLVGQA